MGSAADMDFILSAGRASEHQGLREGGACFVMRVSRLQCREWIMEKHWSREPRGTAEIGTEQNIESVSRRGQYHAVCERLWILHSSAQRGLL